MDRQEPQTISFQVSAKEAEKIKTEAHQLDLSRSDYIRRRLFTPMIDTADARIEMLLNYIIWTQQRLHIALYSIALSQSQLTEEGNKPAVSREKLKSILTDAYDESIKFLAVLPEHLTRMEEDVAAYQQQCAATDRE